VRLRTPIRQRGAQTLRWEAWRRLNAELLRRRCNGHCEGCGVLAPLDVHHVIGRRDEPWSSHIALLAGLCRSCHRSVTGEIGGTNHELRRRLDDEAQFRLFKAFGHFSVAGTKTDYEWDGRAIVRKEVA
jgi:5-methylcytosine-specific restriction endonuclease McrA